MEHLRKFEELLVTYKVKPTIFVPLWKAAGFTLGETFNLLHDTFFIHYDDLIIHDDDDRCWVRAAGRVRRHGVHRGRGGPGDQAL